MVKLRKLEEEIVVLNNTMNKIIFSGTSHTLGLGLELELHPRYSDVEWLKENGVFQTHLNDPIYSKEDYDICKTYRWTRLVSDELGYEEFNCHDYGRMKGGSWPPGPLEFIKVLGDKNENDLKDVEHIIIQTNHLRYNPIDGVMFVDSVYPGLTAADMLNIVEDKDSTDEVKERIYEWIANYDEIEECRNFSKRVGELKAQFPNIKFHILFWDQVANRRFFTKENLTEIWEDLIEFTYDDLTTYSMDELKNKCNLAVADTAFCYTQNKNMLGLKRWKESDVKDEHLSKLGHRVLADNVIKRLKSIL
jgi:hypothetical protein